MEKRQHKCGGGEPQSPVPTAPYPSPSRSRGHNRRALCQQTGISEGRRLLALEELDAAEALDRLFESRNKPTIARQ